MKRFFVLDWYDSLDDPDLLGWYDTLDEAENAIDTWAEATDGECDCVIYTNDKDKYTRIFEIIEGKEPVLVD